MVAGYRGLGRCRCGNTTLMTANGTSSPAEVLVDIAGRIERFDALDPVVDQARQWTERVVPFGQVRDRLRGTAIGHPAHPLLVSMPIGFWTSAMLLDLTGRRSHHDARRLVGAGVLSAVPAVLSGWADWSDIPRAEARVGIVHAGVNATAVACYATSWRARRHGGRAGQGWSLLGAAVLGVGGWLGGHLVYRLGVGVDIDAGEAGPSVEAELSVMGTAPAPQSAG